MVGFSLFLVPSPESMASMNWKKAEAFSLRMGEVCATIPLEELSVPTNDIRTTLALTSFRLAREHHSAIHLLIRYNKNGSANALARSLLEMGLRTFWLAHGASDQEIEDIGKGRDLPKLGALIKHFKNRMGEVLGDRIQGLLHNFTHGGMQALCAQYYEGKDLERLNAILVTVAGRAVFVAASAVGFLTHRDDIRDRLTAAHSEFD